MKRFLFVLILLIAAAGLLAQTTYTWTGSTSQNWSTSGNWSPNGVPTSSDGVIIPSTTNKPHITANSFCNGMIIQTGGELRVLSSYSLTNGGYLTNNGTLTMSSTGGVSIASNLDNYGTISVTGTGPLSVSGTAYWHPGSSTVDSGLTLFNFFGNLTIYNGAGFIMDSGGSVSFKGTADSHIRNYEPTTEFGYLNAAKTAGTGYVNINLDTTQPFKINNDLVNNTGNRFFCSENIVVTLLGHLLDYNLGNTVGTYGIKFNTGTLKMDGAFQYIDLQGPGCWLYNLICSATSGIVSEYNLTLIGNLTIESAYLSVDGYNTIKIAGNWDNQVGPDGFVEGAGRVIFNNSTTWQTILSDETFNILEIDMFSALRFTSGKTVTCAQYDWTSGGIDMNTNATFTANDLADAGIYGKWWLTDQFGAINVTNENVDLKGDITISNGYFNVYSSAEYSTWSSYDDASLVMIGGYLDLHQTGIAVYNVLGSPAPTYLTLSISSGYIRTEGDFEGTWSGFAPTGGIFVFYGSSNSLIELQLGSFYNLTIAKTSATATLWGNDFDLGGWLYVSNGTLDASGIQISCATAFISGQLIMNSKLDSAGGIKWFNDSQLTAANNSIIECGGDWTVESGANVQINSTCQVFFNSTADQTIQIDESNHTIGQLDIGRDSSGATYTGGVYSLSTTSTADLDVPGKLTIRAGNTLDLNQRGMSVGDDVDIWGNLMVDSGDVVVTDDGVVSGGTLQIDTGSVTINGIFYFNPAGTININSGTFALPNYSLGIPTSAVVTLVSGTIRCVTLSVYGTFQPAGGTVVFSSNVSSTSQVYLGPGNWVPNLTIDSNRTYHLSSDINIKGDFTLDFGALDVQHVDGSPVYNIYLAGDWWNNQGPSNFIERTGRVVFNGGGFQAIKTSEDFNIIEVNKVPSGGGGDALRIESGIADQNITVFCNQYDWTAGALDANLRGIFTAADLADDGLYGDYCCNTGCVLNLTNDTNINLIGEMHITGGEVNVVSTDPTVLSSYWPASGPAVMEISSGSLNFPSQGIWIQPTASAWATDITGGTISLAGNLRVRRTDFNPAGGTFAMVGPANATIQFDYAGNSLYDLVINKSSPSTQVELINGSAIPLICRHDFTIHEGKFLMNREDLRVTAFIKIHDGGTMSFNSFNYVRMGASGGMGVFDGGMVDVWGSTADQRTVFTHIDDGYYAVEFFYGSNLTANHVVFEYTNLNGVYIFPGAEIGGLHNCTFQNGMPEGVLFRVDNEQDLNITYANFPTFAGAGSHNVWKSVNAGTVTFSDYLGVFSGTYYEDDPNYRIHWLGASMNLQIVNVTWERPDDYVCAPATVRVYVMNTASNTIVEPFRIDFYKNRASAPAPGEVGDLYQEISSLDTGQTKYVTFTNVSTDVAETWNSWFRVDTDNRIAETDEFNNLWGPDFVQWQALPAVADISIAPGAYPNYVTVSWTYPISVNRFRVYNSDDPYSFVDSTTTPGFSRSYNAATDPSHFFRVTAERDLP